MAGYPPGPSSYGASYGFPTAPSSAGRMCGGGCGGSCGSCQNPCFVLAGEAPPPCYCPQPISKCAIYFRGTEVVPQTIAIAATPTAVTPTKVESIAPSAGYYNPMTGVFTIPAGGQGFYTIQGQVSFIGGASAAQVTTSIIKGAGIGPQVTLTQRIDTVGVSPATAFASLGTGWLLAAAGDTIWFSVSSSVAGVQISTAGTNWSLVRVSYP